MTHKEDEQSLKKVSNVILEVRVMSHKGDGKLLLEVSNVILEAVYSLLSRTMVNAVTFKQYTYSYTEDYRGHFKRHMDDEANIEGSMLVCVFKCHGIIRQENSIE